jgi:hypothetical protein
VHLIKYTGNPTSNYPDFIKIFGQYRFGPLLILVSLASD